MEDALKSQNIYTMLAADTKISGAALGYIYRTDNLIEKLVTPAKDGGGDWKPTRNLISKFFDDMERDLQQVAPPSSNQVTSGFTDWKWDAGREQWYYWCSVDRTFKYENGMWLRLDGSSTSFAEEIELAKAQGIPVRSGPSNINSVAASMQLLTIGRGEDVD